MNFFNLRLINLIHIFQSQFIFNRVFFIFIQFDIRNKRNFFGIREIINIFNHLFIIYQLFLQEFLGKELGLNPQVFFLIFLFGVNL